MIDKFLFLFFNLLSKTDVVTEGDDAYSFFDGLNPGIVVRVNTNNEIQIALTPFNFEWRPMVEIFIGASNNTRSIIRVNQETDVVIVVVNDGNTGQKCYDAGQRESK